MTRLYRMGQAAARADVTIHQARCYVVAGLVVPCATTDGGHHLFDESGIARPRLIDAATRVGLQLAEMRGFCRALDIHDAEKLDATRDLLEARLSEHLDALRHIQKLLTEACGTYCKNAAVTV